MDIHQWRDSGSYFDFDGNKIFYRRKGMGEKVLLSLHGFPTASWDWHKIANDLEKDFSVIYFDFIGFGFSDKPRNNKYSIFQQADIADALLEHFTVGSYHLLAHDYGDTVAQELLARQQNEKNSAQILSCCLLNGGLFPGSYHPRFIQKLLLGPLGPILSNFLSKSSIRRTFDTIFGPNTKANEKDLDQWWEMYLQNGGKKVLHKTIQYMKEREQNEQRWTKALSETSVPLALIDGVYDPISGKRMAETFRTLVPQGELYLLENIGHYPQFEDPNSVVKYFRQFHQNFS